VARSGVLWPRWTRLTDEKWAAPIEAGNRKLKTELKTQQINPKNGAERSDFCSRSELFSTRHVIPTSSENKPADGTNEV
jgi:hypothetical protein